MKTKLFMAIGVLLCGTIATKAQGITGRVVDEENQPVAYANVVALNAADSVYVEGTVTKQDGAFLLNVPAHSEYLLKISSVGYETLYNKVSQGNVGTVILPTASNMLGEVAVTAQRNYVKPSSRGIQVSIAGSPLSQIGNATDALKQMPLIDSSKGSLQVFGKGTPAIYINGRKVQNETELTMLSSGDIKEVEIVTNPSSKYGSDVSAVILIRTVSRNAGFYASANASATASEKWSESGEVNLNYHTEKGLTLFGDFSIGSNGFEQKRYYNEDFTVSASDSKRYNTSTAQKSHSRATSLTADGGLNYDFKGHSMGLKYTFTRTPSSRYQAEANSEVSFIGRENEAVSSNNLLYTQNYRHYLNGFGDFKLPANIRMRIDGDYIHRVSTSASQTEEHTINSIRNRNLTTANMVAGKLNLTKTIGKVGLEAGCDYTHTANKQDFTSTSSSGESFLTPAIDDVRQNLFATYASFDWNPSQKWKVYGGIRYESTHVDYNRNGKFEESLSPDYSDWLPNIGITYNSPVTLTLYYRTSVSRPSYSSLDNNFVYVTPTLWETGNPALQSSLRHKIGLNIYYKKFILQSTYARNRRVIGTIYYHDPDNGINVSTSENMPAYNSLQIVAVQRLDIKRWHPTLQGLLYFQDLDFGNPKHEYDTPLYQLILNNRFDLPYGIYAYLNFVVLGKGYENTLYSKGTWQTSLALNKSFKNWSVTLNYNDLLGTWKQRFGINTNTVDYSYKIEGASRFVSLSVRYTLNSAKGKYKGKSAREDEIRRL